VLAILDIFLGSDHSSQLSFLRLEARMVGDAGRKKGVALGSRIPRRTISVVAFFKHIAFPKVICVKELLFEEDTTKT
jgi:hypothetical protein